MSEFINKPLGEIVKFGNGKSRPKTEGTIPIYGGNGILGYSSEINYEGETVIVGRVGAYCGSTYYENKPIWISDNALSAKAIDGFLPKYIYYILKQKNLNQFAQGSSHPLLTQSLLNTLEAYVTTDLNVQKSIVSILSALEDKIENNRRMNETLEGMAQAIFKSWFVDFDPVHAKVEAIKNGGSDDDARLAAMCAISGKTADALAHLKSENPNDYAQLATTADTFPSAFTDSDLGKIPEGWEVKELSGYLDVLESGARPKGGVKGISSGIPSVGAENINGIGKYIYDKEKYIPIDFFETMKKGKAVDLDVMLYKDGGKPGDFRPRVSIFGFNYPHKKFAINEHVFRLRSSLLGQSFLYHLVAEDKMMHDLRQRGGKAAIPGINQQDVKTLEFIKPDDVLIDAFNLKSELLVELILKSAIENQSLAETRDALLPKLLSGEIDVNKVSIDEI